MIFVSMMEKNNTCWQNKDTAFGSQKRFPAPFISVKILMQMVKSKGISGYIPEKGWRSWISINNIPTSGRTTTTWIQKIIKIYLILIYLMQPLNYAEKRFCEPKATSLFCRQVLFFSIVSFLTPHWIFKFLKNLFEMGCNQWKQPLGTEFEKFIFCLKVGQQTLWNVLKSGLVQ